MNLQRSAQMQLDLAWACLESGRIEQARWQLAKARSLMVGTDVELLRIHCAVIAAWLGGEPAAEDLGCQARAAAEAAERLAGLVTDAAERQAAAEVACRGWAALVRQDRDQDSARFRRRILALAQRHGLSGWVLYERQASAVERCWADGDDLPIQVLQNEAQRLGHATLALHLRSSRWAHEVLVSPGSLAPAVAGLTACAEQARALGGQRVHRYAVAGLLLAAGLRADRRLWLGTLAQHQVAGSGSLNEPVDVAQAYWLALEGRDGEALGTLQDLARRQAIGPAGFALGLLPLLDTLAGTASADRLSQAGSTRVRWTRQFVHWAMAVHAGRQGDRAEAERHAALAIEAAAIYPVARHLAARLVAPSAAADGWGTPITDLQAAEAWFHAQRVPVAARTCRDLLRSLGAPIRRRRNVVSVVPADLRAAGITVREYEVGLLVREHLGNRQIGERLYISHRTVEMHIAALYTKLDLPDRRALVGRMAESGAI